MRPVSDINDSGKLLEYAKSVRLMQFASPQTLGDTTRLVHQAVSLSDKTMPIKAYFDFVRQTQIDGRRPGCFEDEFMLAVGYLQLEVSNLSGVIYLKGESPDYKQFKHKRRRVDTSDSTLLKATSAKLAMPNEQRGKIEQEMIQASVKRLTKLTNLYELVPEVVRRLKAGALKPDIMREVKVGEPPEPMTRIDWDIISRMARRMKLYTFRQKEKDPSNAYELSSNNHKRVGELATQWGVTPRRALNRLLDDFWSIKDRQQLFGVSPPLTTLEDAQRPAAKASPSKTAKKKSKHRKS
jgi:hypothetical protein